MERIFLLKDATRCGSPIHIEAPMKTLRLLIVGSILLTTHVVGQTIPGGPEVVNHGQEESQNLDSGISAYYQGAYSEAYSFLAPLAERGVARAQFRVAVMLQNGRGVDRNPAAARQLYLAALAPIRKAAKNGETWAQADLGSYYEEGLVLQQNYQEAAGWYELAAKQGYAGAQTNLGVLYANGKGVEPSLDRAVDLFRLAAAQGDAVAKENLRLFGIPIPDTQLSGTEYQSVFEEHPESSDSTPEFLHPKCLDAFMNVTDAFHERRKSMTWAECDALAVGVPFWKEEDKMPDGTPFEKVTYKWVGPWAEGEYPWSTHPWFIYQRVGKFEPNRTVFRVHWNQGGNGDTAALTVIKGLSEEKTPEGILEEVWGVYYGDRCNGGIVSAKALDSQKVIVRSYLTSFDIVTKEDHPGWVVDDNWDNPSPRRGDTPVISPGVLPACAACCGGTEGTVVDIAATDQRKELVQDWTDIRVTGSFGTEWPLDYCLGELMSDEYSGGRPIEAKEYRTFQDRFNARCVQPWWEALVAFKETGTVPDHLTKNPDLFGIRHNLKTYGRPQK